MFKTFFKSLGLNFDNNMDDFTMGEVFNDFKEENKKFKEECFNVNLEKLNDFIKINPQFTQKTDYNCRHTKIYLYGVKIYLYYASKEKFKTLEKRLLNTVKDKAYLFCTECDKTIFARRTDGSEVYPHSQMYKELPFYICDTCKNYVGCHYKSKEPTKPLGCIPSDSIRKWRGILHRLIDPQWKNAERKNKKRAEVYSNISKAIGKQYHTAEIMSIAEAKRIYAICKNQLNF